MWKFWASWFGYVRANSQAQAGKLSEAEKDRIWADLETFDAPKDEISTQTYLWDGWFNVQGRVKI